MQWWQIPDLIPLPTDCFIWKLLLAQNYAVHHRKIRLTEESILLSPSVICCMSQFDQTSSGTSPVSPHSSGFWMFFENKCFPACVNDAENYFCRLYSDCSFSDLKSPKYFSLDILSFKYPLCAEPLVSRAPVNSVAWNRARHTVHIYGETIRTTSNLDELQPICLAHLTD